jgi:DNA-binding transcriptional ArsR family regulator
MLSPSQIADLKNEISAYDEDGLPAAFRALGDPGRFKIFKLLIKHGDICVTDVANILSVTVSAASQQLSTLERFGLVLKTKMGQVVCYEINTKSLIADQIVKILKGSNRRQKTE